MKFFLITVLFSLFLTVLAAGPGFEAFFDSFLTAMLKAKGDLIDPLKLEDQTIILTPDALRFLPRFLKPEVDVKETYLKGLKTLHRSGSAIQSTNPKNNKVTVAELSIAPLEVDTKVFFHHLGMYIGRDVKMTSSNFDFIVEFEGNKTLQTLLVPRFEVVKMDDLKVTVKGSRVTDGLTNRIMNHVIPLLKKRIIRAVEEGVQQLLEEKVNELDPKFKSILW